MGCPFQCLRFEKVRRRHFDIAIGAVKIEEQGR
jgi:hypothetical protein